MFFCWVGVGGLSREEGVEGCFGAPVLFPYSGPDFAAGWGEGGWAFLSTYILVRTEGHSIFSI
jgi:hypothetical protein